MELIMIRSSIHRITAEIRSDFGGRFSALIRQRIEDYAAGKFEVNSETVRLVFLEFNPTDTSRRGRACRSSCIISELNSPYPILPSFIHPLLPISMRLGQRGKSRPVPCLRGVEAGSGRGGNGRTSNEFCTIVYLVCIMHRSSIHRLEQSRADSPKTQ
jgi:hypothetical protein